MSVEKAVKDHLDHNVSIAEHVQVLGGVRLCEELEFHVKLFVGCVGFGYIQSMDEVLRKLKPRLWRGKWIRVDDY